MHVYICSCGIDGHCIALHFVVCVRNFHFLGKWFTTTPRQIIARKPVAAIDKNGIHGTSLAVKKL